MERRTAGSGAECREDAGGAGTASPFVVVRRRHRRRVRWMDDAWQWAEAGEQAGEAEAGQTDVQTDRQSDSPSRQSQRGPTLGLDLQYVPPRTIVLRYTFSSPILPPLLPVIALFWRRLTSSPSPPLTLAYAALAALRAFASPSFLLPGQALGPHAYFQRLSLAPRTSA